MNWGMGTEKCNQIKTYNSLCITNSRFTPIGTTTAGIGRTEGGEREQGDELTDK